MRSQWVCAKIRRGVQHLADARKVLRGLQEIQQADEEFGNWVISALVAAASHLFSAEATWLADPKKSSEVWTLRKDLGL